MTAWLLTSLCCRCVCISAHSPDNSFMGFVVENYLNDSVNPEIQRKNQAVVYGKAEYMWQVSTLSVPHRLILLCVCVCVGMEASTGLPARGR